MSFTLPKVQQNRNLSNQYRRSSNLNTLFNSLLDDFFYQNLNGNDSGQDIFLSPRTDISESESEYKVELEMPGISQENIEIKMNDNILTVKGHVEEEKEEEERNYYSRERCYGSFQRSVSLPTNVSTDNIKASLSNGILNILIPKKEQASVKKIEIK